MPGLSPITRFQSVSFSPRTRLGVALPPPPPPRCADTIAGINTRMTARCFTLNMDCAPRSGRMDHITMPHGLWWVQARGDVVRERAVDSKPRTTLSQTVTDTALTGLLLRSEKGSLILR